MSANDRRLIADHSEVVKTIRQYRNISLISTSGEPVDEYEIEYRVKGYITAPDGKVTTANRHRIKIRIPFGYPHFPPTIHPLSPVFHPEVDDHVVPIANYWEETKSLPDLILHIGNMLCGSFSSNEMPINREAAEFYRKHQSSLPLDSLKQVEEKKPKVKKERRRSRMIPAAFFYTTSICLVLGLVGTGGLFLFEKWRLDQAADIFSSALDHHREREFQKAQETAEEARDKLVRYYLLHDAGRSLREDIDSFLRSEPLIEGLKGNIRYGDKYISMEQAQQIEFLRELAAEADAAAEEEELSAAVDIYHKAMEYADTHGLQSEKERFLPDYAEIQLEVLVEASEIAHAGDNREKAIERHTEVIDFIEKYANYLESGEKQAADTRYLLLIDQIAFFSREALEAENRNDFESALKYHNLIISHITEADSTENTILKSTLTDSLQKTAYLTEKINIEDRRQWLLANYKKIFQIHNPAVVASSLRNPQAVFVKYDEETMVFDLSCLEKGSGSVVRLRIFYQYNPVTEGWSLYKGEIETS